jgi:hypothetical protein
MNTLVTFYQNLGLALSLMVIATFLLAGMIKGVIGLDCRPSRWVCSVWLWRRRRLPRC